MDSLTVLRIFLTVAALAIALMAWLANYRTHDALPQAEVTAKGYAIRKYWFWLTLVVAVVVFAITIPSFPYSKAAAAHDVRHYPIAAVQYGFLLPKSVPLRHAVVFDVTSKDVNHGFGIYAPDGRVVSQVQAMPGYVNHLEVTFTEPGHYTIRCLEYCGIGHAAMQGGFDVQ